MIELIKYCLKDIIVTSELLKVQNSNFHKRCLSRLIAIRIDDFIKLCFKLNKDTLNDPAIKGDLNALKDLYEEFFKKQRDKYGAHVQDLDFSERIELWANIDFEKADFFVNQPIEIYNRFSTVPGYQNTTAIFDDIPLAEVVLIAKKNKELNIEDTPRFSSDILSLTRYNTGGMLYCSPVQDKAAVLKALELIIKYDIEIVKTVETNASLRDSIKKLLILDVVSYCDNLFTRTDLLPGAKQEMKGLDHFINAIDFKVAKKLLDDFKISYKLTENIDLTRGVRNTVCGHITPTASIPALEGALNSLSIEFIEDFYNQLKNLFKQVCYQEFTFKPFLLEPDKIHGVSGFSHNPSKPFKKDETPETTFKSPDSNSETEIGKHYEQLIKNENSEDVRHFFWEGFSSSEIIEKKHVEALTVEGNNKYQNFDFRKHHQFFLDKLGSADVSFVEKISIVNLFNACRSGFPDTLKEILLETYEVNKTHPELNLAYLNAFGELADEREKKIFDILTANCTGNNFYTSLFAMNSIFKIDVCSRRIGHGLDVELSENDFSKFIKQIVLKLDNNFYRLSYLLNMASELVFGSRCTHYHKKLGNYYGKHFSNEFEAILRDYLNPIIKDESDNQALLNIIQSFNTNRFSTGVCFIAELLDKYHYTLESKNFLNILCEGLVKIANQDDQEVQNLGYAFTKLNLIQNALEISKHLSNKNPSNIEFRISLLELYKENGQTAEYDSLKNELLTKFNLTTDQTRKITAI